MSKIRHILSVIHDTIRGTVLFQFTHFPCDDWDYIYTLSYYHHQIESMNYYPLFRIRSWTNGVHCMSICILIDKLHLKSVLQTNYLNWEDGDIIAAIDKMPMHDDVIKWKHFPRNWPFVRGIHRYRWIPHTKASDAELWCLLWSASE